MKILVGVNGRPIGDYTIDNALVLARRIEAEGSQSVALYLVPEGDDPIEALHQALQRINGAGVRWRVESLTP